MFPFVDREPELILPWTNSPVTFGTHVQFLVDLAPMQNQDTIPQSYYLMAMGDTRKLGTRANTMLKVQERQVAFQQDPIGWLFFSYDNVDRLIALLSKSFGNVDFALISPAMQRIYHMDGVAGHLALRDCTPDRLIREVDRLDRQLEKMVSQELLNLSAANTRYKSFIQDGRVGFERHSQWTRETRREGQPDPGSDLLAQQQGFIFAPQTQQSRVMPAAGKDLFADYPVKALQSQAQTRWP